MEKETVKCKWCSTETRMTGTKMCDSCWELEHRIEMNLTLAKRMIKEIENGCNNKHRNN
jgi:hypothetical protein